MGYTLGVDLGTTFTAAAIARDGRAEVVPLGDHAAQVPSVLFVREDGALLVGDAAVRRGASQPDRVAREVKRRLGDRTPLLLGGEEFPAPVLLGRLLRWVVETVVERQGGPADRIAVTHPATWGPHRREVLQQVVREAGVGPVTTVPEPVAAAVHFASTERVRPGDALAVYDLGGGTFDAAVLRRTDEAFELLGPPAGLDQLGGLDFDDEVLSLVLAQLGPEVSELDPDDEVVLTALARLRRECTEAKEALSTDSEAVVAVALPGLDTTVRVRRGDLEDAVRPSLERTLESLHRAMAGAGVSAADLAGVVLVGGSTRIPLVAEVLGHDLGRPVAVSPQPKLCVALGAALLAGGATPRALEPQEHTPRAPVEPAPEPESAPVQRPDPPFGAGTWQDSRRLARTTGGLLAAALVTCLLPVLLTGPPRSAFDTTRPQGVDAVSGGGAGVTVLPDAAGIEGEATLAWIPVPEGTDAGERPCAHGLDGELAGPVRCALSQGGDEIASFAAVPTRRWFTTITGWVPLGILLFVLAYAESILRPVRRRRSARTGDLVGMATLGALAGVGLVVATWAWGQVLVHPVAVAVAIVGCAGASVATTRLVVLRSRRPRAAPAALDR